MGFPALKRARRHGESGVLIGVRSICRYAHISPVTFYRWTREYEFPAARLPDNRWCTSFSLIDGWIAALVQAQTGHRQQLESQVDTT